MANQIITDAENRMKYTVEATRKELQNIRTGRANAGILEHVMVSAYGADMPVNQVAQISIPEARQLVITPFDRSVLPAIEKAILKSDLGMNPNSDGICIRLNIPAMTEERRKQMVKQTHTEVEHGRVAVRNVRRDANEHLLKANKAHEISEDELKRLQADVQRLTDKYITELDGVQKTKEAELMEV
ncbi:MAG TPA: ribosome recycling factor [Armatimonadota bacterium]|jgi:ribosome recycling factor